MAYRSLLEWERSQIGQKNDADGSNKYVEWYMGYRAKNVAWCAIFQAYGFNELGILDRLDGLTNKAGCEPWRRWAVSKGIFSKTPRVGSIVLYDWNPEDGDGADHIGIVDQIVAGGIMAIEGNTSEDGSINGGHVLRKFRDNRRIMGYVYVDTEIRPEPCVQFERVAGADRFETSEASAKKKDAAVVVNGINFPDALSAAYFAKQKNGSIVLTSKTRAEQTSEFLKGFGEVYIVGGEVPDFNGATRIAGLDRYDTNLAVLETCETPNKQILIATGDNFPDGLCGGMIDRPLMLVSRALRDEQFGYLRERGFERFYVLGGGVHPDVKNELAKLGEVTEFFGANRYATAQIIASRFYRKADTLVIASGKSFADGISAANIGDYPLLFADHGHTEETRTFVRQINPRRAIVVGGAGAVSDDVANWALTK